MTIKKNIRKNIQSLETLRDNKTGKVPNTILGKINTVVELYKERKITQRATAERLINNIATNNQKQRTKGLKEYDKAVEKYQSTTPVGERMAGRAEKAGDAKKVKDVRKIITEKSKASAVSRMMKVAKQRGIGNRKYYSIKFMLYSLEPIGRIIRGKKINGLVYYPMFDGGKPRGASIRVGEFIETVVNRTVTKQFEKPMFKKLLMFLKTDSALRDIMPDMLDYVDAIQITKVEKTDDDGRPYNIEDEGLRETSNLNIYHFYHETLIDVEKETVKEAIQQNDINENECWINELLKTYEGTELTKEKRGSQSKTLSRKKILELLNMTDDEIHEYGISINHMKKVFSFFNIPVKLYNFQCQLIYKYEPNIYKNGKNIKTFVALIKNNHVYPMNTNLERLCH